MIKEFVDRYINAKAALIAQYQERPPENYDAIFRDVVSIVSSLEDNYDTPDVDRITTLDHGHYQGTIVFIVGSNCYQPHRYWYTKVSYGSCSGCDTFRGIRRYSGDPVTEAQATQYWTLGLHMVQNMKEME